MVVKDLEEKENDSKKEPVKKPEKQLAKSPEPIEKKPAEKKPEEKPVKPVKKEEKAKEEIEKIKQKLQQVQQIEEEEYEEIPSSSRRSLERIIRAAPQSPARAPRTAPRRAMPEEQEEVKYDGKKKDYTEFKPDVLASSGEGKYEVVSLRQEDREKKYETPVRTEEKGKEKLPFERKEERTYEPMKLKSPLEIEQEKEKERRKYRTA